MGRPVVSAGDFDDDAKWTAVYGGGSTCPDGERHRPEILWDESVTCFRCDALLKPEFPPAPSPRWRFLELNANLASARFLAVQIEGQKVAYDPDWRRFEETAKADGLFEQPINSIGNRHGEWHEGAIP